uniref:hypothetical protein n=1 Tax=Chitinimonas sp. TaxID=1934313 RepID=UPI0035B370BF
SNDNIGVGDNSPVAGRVEGLPTDARESALLLTLPAGAYSAVMEGVNGSTGVGLLAVDTVVNPQETGSVINLSFRGDVGAGDNVVIAGFIIVGGSKNVLLTARGPSLAQAGVSGVLARPMLELRDARGALISSNAGLGNAPNLAAIHATGMAPANADESAILQQLPEGAYSVIARGLNGGQGVVLMAVEQVD